MNPRIDPDTLLSHSGWMRALAFELLGDHQGAEDVVQETWLAAMTRGPEELRNPRGWLARVVRNLAHMRGRGELRRQRREQTVARGEAQPSAAPSLEKFEVHRALVEAIGELNSPDREIVVLRYYEELSTRVVAQRLGLTESAVRSRLSRSLEKLRIKLDDAYDGERRHWALALATWTAPPASSVGVLAWTGLAAAVAVALFFGRELVSGPSTAPTVQLDPLAQLEAEGARQEVGGAEDRPTTPSTSITTPKRSALAAAPPREEARGAERAMIGMRVVSPLGQPLRDVRGRVRGAGDDEVRSSDDEGRLLLEFDWPPAQGTPGGYVYVDLMAEGFCGRWVRARFADTREQHLGDVVLEAGGRVTGLVVDTSGRPVSGAEVFAGEPPESVRWDARQLAIQGTITLGNERATTNSEGRYVLEGIPARKLCVFGRTSQSFYAFAESFVVRAGRSTEAPLLVIEPARDEQHMQGRVLDPDGEPLAKVRISIHGADGTRLGGAYFTDTEGHFDALIPEAKDHWIAAMHPDHGELVLRPAATGVAHELRFEKARFVEIRAKDEDGRPIEGLEVRSSITDDYGTRLLGKELEPGLARMRIPSRDFEFTVDAPGWLPTRCGPYAPDTTPPQIEVQLERAPGIAGRLVIQGKAVPGARLHLHRVLKTQGQLESGFASRVHPRQESASVSGADGRFFLELPEAGADPSVEPGLFELHAEGHLRCRSAWERVATGPPQAEPPFRTTDLGDLEWPSSGTLAGELQLGSDPSGRTIAASCGNGHTLRQVLGPDGLFRFERLTPGLWQVGLLPKRSLQRGERLRWARAGEEQPAFERHEVFVSADGVAQVLLRPAVSTTCTLEGELRLGNETPIFTSAILARAGERRNSTIDGDGRFAFRIEGTGPTTLLMLANPEEAVRTHLQSDVELGPGANYWRFTPSTGTLELLGLGEGTGPPPHADFRNVRYALIRLPSAGETTRFHIELAQNLESLKLSYLPAGRYLLQSAPYPFEPGAKGTTGFEEVWRFELPAGGYVRHDLGR